MAPRLFRVLLLALAATVARADIAPTRYVGRGLVPVDAPGMRMVSAKVDLVWGTPCTLSATFVIENEGANPRDIDLGFPVTHRSFDGRVNQVPGDLLFAFNGTPLPHASIAIDDPVTRKLRSLYSRDEMDAANMTITEVLLLLEQKSKELDPEHVATKFVLTAPPEDPSAKVGINYGRGFSLLDLLDGALSASHLQYSVGDNTVYVHPAVKGGHNPDDFTWYRCHHTFPPGQTSVSIKTELPASGDFTFPYREHLFYCIETGGAWAGTIGSEQVDIHFPEPVEQGQIISGDPGNYGVAGNKVRWLFINFKPHGEDHDIELVYLRPDIMSVLARTRAGHDADPANPALTLQLIKDLFELGPDKGYSPYPPETLNPDEFAALKAKLPHFKDQELLDNAYSPGADGKYHQKNDDLSAGENDLIRALGEVGYQAPWRRSPYVDEARALLEKLLKDQPTNAEAWRVYFLNYYRFRFTAGIMEARAPFYPDEIEKIKQAIALCPDDPCLQAWFHVITNDQGKEGDPEHALLYQYIQKQRDETNYPKIKYNDDH